MWNYCVVVVHRRINWIMRGISELHDRSLECHLATGTMCILAHFRDIYNGAGPLRSYQGSLRFDILEVGAAHC